jgi:glycosyltransferase involved in cell wall biosynthesis
VRVLHVVGNMNRAGAETWLMHVLRHIDRRRFQFDFLVHADRDYAYADEIRALGGRLVVCTWPTLPSSYARRFRAILDRHGPYDVVHSHLNHVGSWILWLAQSRRVPCRILHTHTARPLADAPALVRAIDRGGRCLQRAATHCLAVSEIAARRSFGEAWHRLPHACVLPCGIDLSPFDAEIDRRALRRQLGLRDDDYVIGHVGRFIRAKNHELVLQIAAAVRHDARVRFLLVGDGPRRRAIERQAQLLGLGDRVIFAGVRDDVPQIMRACMDGFVLPSRYEGLGLVAIEAQAAGLHCVLADTVPSEVIVCPALVRVQSLADSPALWVTALLDRDGTVGRQVRELSGRDAVRRSAFNVQRSVETLVQLYVTVGQSTAA